MTLETVLFLQEGAMCLCLCDTNANEDLHINDELVKAEYADFVPDNSPKSSSPVGQVLICLCNVFYKHITVSNSVEFV